MLSQDTFVPTRRLLAGAACLTPVALSLSACSRGVLNPQGPVGKAELLLLYNSTTIMLAVVVPVILMTLLVVWWFRAGNARARYQPLWEYSGRIEFIVWAIPMLVILFLGSLTWVASHDLDPPRPLQTSVEPVEVDVVSVDWRWLFIYPAESVASIDELTVPAGVPIHFRLTSFTVMNSFFVPQLGSQIYTMPGMTTQLNLQADRAATYQGLSAQFSGDGFSDMRFELHAVSSSEFDAWVSGARERGENLDRSRFLQLARPGRSGAPMTYSPVEAGLFDAISSGHLAASQREP